jgi:hypothetical protein
MLLFNLIWESLRQKQETSSNNDAKNDDNRLKQGKIGEAGG